MNRLRTHVFALALLTVGVRLGGLVLGFSAVCDCGGADAHGGSPVAHECCKRGAAEDTCPMHRGAMLDGGTHHEAAPDSDPAASTMSCSCNHSQGLDALVGAAGVLVSAQHVGMDLAFVGDVCTFDEAAVETPRQVFLPPPRA